MQVTRNVITIFDINTSLQKKELTINKNYQRNGALWPINAASFFIDTILNGFPFPKVTIRQTINPSTMKSIKEVVDGQQRLSVINKFINNEFSLSSVSNDFNGLYFRDLSESVQQQFLSYEVSVDTVISGTEKEILEVFRRMNSYSLPLNKQELRHSNYQGEFKWFMFNFSEKYSDFLIQTNILTLKRVSRMFDTELFSEICLTLRNGIEQRSQTKLDNLYKQYDTHFPENKKEQMEDLLNYIVQNFIEICDHESMKSYHFYSFCVALLYNKFGNDTNIKISDFESEGTYCKNINIAKNNILSLLDFLSIHDDENNFHTDNKILKDFLSSSSAATNNSKNRIIRTQCFLAALQDNL